MTLLIPLGFLAALVAATHWSLAWWTAALPTALGLGALTLARRPWHVAAGIALVAAALAILRTDYSSAASQSALTRLVSERQVTALRGEVVDEPSPRDRAQLVRLRVNAVRFVEGEWRVMDGVAQVTARLTPPIHYGEFLEVRGRVQPLEAGATPGYAAYLRRQGFDAVVAFPVVEHRGERAASGLSVRSLLSGSWIQDVLVWLRGALATSLERLLPEPHAALAQGILVGRRATVPPELTEQLRVNGLAHISAVSGLTGKQPRGPSRCQHCLSGFRERP